MPVYLDLLVCDGLIRSGSPWYNLTSVHQYMHGTFSLEVFPWRAWKQSSNHSSNKDDKWAATSWPSLIPPDVRCRLSPRRGAENSNLLIAWLLRETKYSSDGNYWREHRQKWSSMKTKTIWKLSNQHLWISHSHLMIYEAYISCTNLTDL
jgi:hypothetical protein